MIPVGAFLIRRPPALASENAWPSPPRADQSVSPWGKQCGPRTIHHPDADEFLLTVPALRDRSFHTVSYGDTAHSMIAAVSIYSVEGIAGMGGRVASASSATGLARNVWSWGSCQASARRLIFSCAILTRLCGGRDIRFILSRYNALYAYCAENFRSG